MRALRTPAARLSSGQIASLKNSGFVSLANGSARPSSKTAHISACPLFAAVTVAVTPLGPRVSIGKPGLIRAARASNRRTPPMSFICTAACNSLIKSAQPSQPGSKWTTSPHAWRWLEASSAASSRCWLSSSLGSFDIGEDGTSSGTITSSGTLRSCSSGFNRLPLSPLGQHMIEETIAETERLFLTPEPCAGAVNSSLYDASFVLGSNKAAPSRYFRLRLGFAPIFLLASTALSHSSNREDSWFRLSKVGPSSTSYCGGTAASAWEAI
mmetsp:Transcript_47965/g.95433  ORF Transcript_47965/g.95433 Transcript_47965/m.95433 type:complete len:269 (-) Transcript_47965:75-881(-)